MRRLSTAAVAGIVVLSALVCSCSGQRTRVTGGGMLLGVDRATIAGEASSCDGIARGQFEYISHDADVSLHGEVTEGTLCTGPDCAPCASLSPDFKMQIGGTYRSTSDAYPGNGTFVACMSDNGQGGKASGPDTAGISILTGPYAGYTNSGILLGNGTTHKCPHAGAQP